MSLEDSQVLPENELDFHLGEFELTCGKQDVGCWANKGHGAKGPSISGMTGPGRTFLGWPLCAYPRLKERDDIIDDMTREWEA